MSAYNRKSSGELQTANCKLQTAAAAARGQIAIVMMILVAVLAVMGVLCFQAYFSITNKNTLQNAGDAAAIAAARAQGRLLNEIGRLNLRQVVDILHRRPSTAMAEARALAICGPVDNALPAAQDAARENHAFNDPAAAEFLRERGDFIASDIVPNLPEEVQDSVLMYVNSLETVLSREYSGLAAVPENMAFFDFDPAGHILYQIPFYEAILGRDWCYFHFNAMDLLLNYKNYHDWDPLPPAERAYDTDNSEIFPLYLRPAAGDIVSMTGGPENLFAALERAGLADGLSAQDLATNRFLRSTEHVWYCYDPAHWRSWQNELLLDEFMTGSVKPEFDISGADAAVRVQGGGLVWNAAAKPFGVLFSASGERLRATEFGVVLPCFTDVRLIPLDAVHGGWTNYTPVDWMRHVFSHLEPYMERGPAACVPGCRWCDALRTWERASFRRTGRLWLENHSNLCRRPSSGPGHSGGRRHGH